MYTFQDFQDDVKALGINEAVNSALSKHKSSEEYRIALDADNYDRQKNTTITRFIKKVFTLNGRTAIDEFSSNNKLCSSFFRRLNTQRNTYSLGNGIQFVEENIKERLGEDFDTRIKDAGYYALIHGVSFLFWNVNHVHVYKVTEFVPLYDEETGALRAGIRFWQIDSTKPEYAVLYEEDGYTKYRKADTDRGGTGRFEEVQAKSAYRINYAQADTDTEPEIVGEENYTSLPIVALYGSRLKQSTLIGMKTNIDAYDLVRSGFANDLSDCSEIYWIVNGAGGMDDVDLANFRTRLKINHIASVENEDEAKVTPYTQEIPFNARKEFLEEIRSGIYEDFGGLDVHTISAGATNDHIEAGYQPLDEQADDFEYELIETIQQLTKLIFDKEYTPLFNRNRISNQKERTDMVIECANYLDDETILNHLPFLTSDEVQAILERKQQDDMDSFIPDDVTDDTEINDDIEPKQDDEGISPPEVE